MRTPPNEGADVLALLSALAGAVTMLICVPLFGAGVLKAARKRSVEEGHCRGTFGSEDSFE